MDVMEVRMRSALVLAIVVGLGSPAYAQVAGGGFGYARLGTGAVLTGAGRSSAPAFGFGYRGELDAVAVDFSFLNFIVDIDRHLAGDGVFAGSLVRLQVLRFLDPEADRSFYLGGGMSYGRVSAGDSRLTDTSYTSGWGGAGLQGEFAAGYELARSSPIRLFVQGDVGLPLFNARMIRYPVVNRSTDYNSPAVEKRYMPSVAVTFGLGWHRP